MLSSAAASQSRPCRFFPPGCTFLVATTIACCLCHLVRVTSTLAVGIVVKFARRQLLQLLRCSITHCGFLPKEDDLLTALPCDLPTCHLFRDSHLLGLTLHPFAPVFRCHRVSWTRGRLTFAQEAVRASPFSLFSIFLFLLIFVRSFRQALSKFSSSGVEMRRICNYVKLFLGSPTFQVPTLYSTICSGYTWERSKITASCCVVFDSFV